MAILDWIYPKKCLGCGRQESYICLECRKGVQRKGVGLAYSGVVRKVIKEIKYRGSYDLVSELVEIWRPMRPQGEFVVTAVPMWRGKKRVRGYNQAELIAREVAKQWGVDYLELLMRVRETKPMYGLDRESRILNVRGAFKIKPNINLISTKEIVLVDDVWTSGATMQECARVLKQLGRGSVVPMALAS